MKVIQLAMILVCGSVYTLSAASETSHGTPHEEEVALLQNAERSLQNINTEIDRYLAYYSALLKENEASMRASGEWEAELTREAALKKSVKKLQEDFIAFRESFDQAIMANYGLSTYARLISARNVSDLTEWYAKQVKEMIFPEQWEESAQTKQSPVQSENKNGG